MAEPIGVTAGLIGIATFALQISKEVYGLVNSIQKAPQTIRDLKSELLALDPILNSIREVIAKDTSKFEDIRYPLHQCGMVCFHLRSLIRKCTEHSEPGTRSLRDWLKMQYKGKTIDDYKSQLASYKATMGIALSVFTLTNGASTAEAIEKMKAMLQDAIDQAQPDLEVQIEEINDSLESLATQISALSEGQHHQSVEVTDIEARKEVEKALEEERRALEAEKEAMEQSQKVCATSKELITGRKGHEFFKNLTTGEASAQFGNFVADGYTGKMEGGDHIYWGNVASQKATVRYGNTYGGKP